jgi:hypothetical protein
MMEEWQDERARKREEERRAAIRESARVAALAAFERDPNIMSLEEHEEFYVDWFENQDSRCYNDY